MYTSNKQTEIMKNLNFKKTETYTGGEVAGYENVKTYECGSWSIGREGKYIDDTFINWAGDWDVTREDEVYGTFNTLKEAKQYICKWIQINPSDV